MSNAVNMNEQTSTKHPILVEVANAITHGIGTACAIVGLIFLILKAVSTGSPMRIVTFTIYGSILILFYLSSTLYHALSFTRAKGVFRKLDHSMIYVLIAGTYTPYCLVAIKGWLGWTIFGIIWAMAIGGIIYKCLAKPHKSKWSTVFYVVMGWFCVIALWPLFKALGTMGLTLLVAGGITFTVGTFFYSRPNPWNHVIWHLFVFAGTVLMYFSIILYC